MVHVPIIHMYMLYNMITPFITARKYLKNMFNIYSIQRNVQYCKITSINFDFVFLVIQLTEQCHPTFDPMAFRFISRQINWHNIVGRMSCRRESAASFTCFVYRSSVCLTVSYIDSFS